MERVSVAAVDPRVHADGTAQRGLSAPLDATHLAINHYRVPPGAGLPGGLHAHLDQEEVFVVLEGTATFETPAGAVDVGAGEAVRFAPGEFQSGRNAAGADLVVLALGAPPGSEDVRIPVACPACGFANRRLETDDGGVAFVCPDCGATDVPRPCPACGQEALRVTLGDGDGDGAGTDTDIVVGCQGCGATFDEPPLREG